MPNDLKLPDVQFSTFTPTEQALVDAISLRAVGMKMYRRRKDAEMDISATHVHCPLDLVKLLNAPDTHFGHDMGGIRDNLNRTTGRLENFFDPRCSLPEVTP